MTKVNESSSALNSSNKPVLEQTQLCKHLQILGLFVHFFNLHF